MEADNAGRVGLSRDGAAGQQSLGLGGKAERPAIVRVIKRLDAERIAGEQQAVLLRIPQSEGEHTAEGLDHGGATIRIELKQNLGIGLVRKVYPRASSSARSAR